MAQVARGQRIKELVQRKADLTASELQELSSLTNNAAASGTQGASVDAVNTDLQMQYDRARASLQEEGEIDDFNFNQQLVQLLQDSRDSMSQLNHAKVPGWGQILFKAGMDTAMTYGQSRVSLGLGAKPADQGVRFKG